MTVTLIGIAIFGFVALVIYAVATQADERATVRASLRQLDDYKVENVRDQEMLAPLSERLFAPALGGLTALGRRFTPVGYVDNTKKKLLITGKAQPDDLDRFLAVRVLTILAIIPAIYFWFNFVSLKGKAFYFTLLLVILALVLGPDAVLNRKKEERQLIIRRALPDILDLLTISVEAGLGFEQALDRTVKSVPGPLSDEFTRMLNETRAGSSRADAMRAIDDRTDVAEVRSFVLAILQADTFGVSIGRILRAQADEMRIKRRQEAQERAQKAPVKMLIPMVFCVFPALFVIILGPAAISLTKNFK
ncbi:MAG: type II secretion system F family protein [Acidimicrobiales bacterium]